MLICSLVFLGNSQTFLGVLATIVVMCVLVGDNNFIFKILTLIKKQMEDNLRNVSAVVSFNKLHDDSDYKLLKLLLRGKEQLKPEQKEEGINLLNDVNLWKSSFQAESAKPDLRGIDRELTLAPLYTFLFVLFVFMVDELLRTTLFPFNDLLVSTLTLFTLFSSIYWVGKWVTFSFDIFHNDGKRTYTLLSGSRWSNFMQSLQLGFLQDNRIRHIAEFLWFVAIIFFLWIIRTHGSLTCYLLTIFGVIVPLVFEGLFHLYPKSVPEIKADNGYSTTISHFCRFLLLAFALSLFYALLNRTTAFDGILIQYDSLQWLKVFTIGFVILNGLFIPFIVPYQTYRLLSDIFRNKPYRIQKKVDKDINIRLDEIRLFTAKCKVE